MGKIKRIGVFTGGGDCAGLNAFVRGVAGVCNSTYGIEAVMIPGGSAGLYYLHEMNPEELVVLTEERADQILVSYAGAEPGNSRANFPEIKERTKYKNLSQGMEIHSIDALLGAGGDDTGKTAKALARRGFRIGHVGKTMDWDLQVPSVGFDSAINQIAEECRRLRTTGETHRRLIILEVFGRYVGHTAFRGGIAGDADCIIIPEIQPDFDIVYEHFFNRYTTRIKSSDIKKGWYLLVTSQAMRGESGDEVNDDGFLIDKSKGKDPHDHWYLAGAGDRIQKELQTRMKGDKRLEAFMREQHMYVAEQCEIPEVRVIRPEHLIRCGTASAYDVNLGKEAGAAGVALLVQGYSGFTGVGRFDGTVEFMPISRAVKPRPVDLEKAALHEAMGVCFGREPVDLSGLVRRATEVKHVERYL